MYNSRAKNTIIWDLDNTLWDWVAYAAKAYPAMRDALTEATGATREQVTACMKKYYGRAETMESSWLVQDFGRQGLFNGLDVDQARLIETVRATFHASRAESLTLYDGIPEVLRAVHADGFYNVILTDAPACHAASRIKHLDLNQENLFREMLAMRDSLPDEVPIEMRRNFDRGRYGLQFPVHHMDREKPDTDLEGILRMTREEISRYVTIVGDSYPKDMRLAARYGCTGVHAGWGRPNPEDHEIVSQFAEPRPAATSFPAGAHTPNFRMIAFAEQPSDVLRVLGI